MNSTGSHSAVLPGSHDAPSGPSCHGQQVDQPRSHDDTLLKHAKLMLVDDEPVNVNTVQKYLTGIGYDNIVTTTDSSQALSLIEREQPDLLLLDIMMPRVNGLELLQAIQDHEHLHDLPVIILTASRDLKVRLQALEVGAKDFLAKPVDPRELALRIGNVLLAKTLGDQAARRGDQLEAEIEQQALQLANARHAADLRYMAGKAEIATDVLHNVGNALQSVNTGVNLVAYTVRESKLPLLKRAGMLLHEHADNLPKFLTKDQRGKLLPSYLIELTDSLLKEREKIACEIDLLTKHLEHINAVVATQQKFAALCNVQEEVHLPDLLADVEELVGRSFAQQSIEIVRDYEEVPVLRTDRQKLMQVLLNLVKNAIDAIKHSPTAESGQLVLRFGHSPQQHCLIEVADNGEGIAQDKLLQIFSHGYSTKPQGHGFGLHSCANIMKELGGSIRVESEGKSQGAKFILELPWEQSEGESGDPP